MSNTLLLIIAVAVFSLMLVGIALTIFEFSRGEPARQDEAHRSGDTDAEGAPDR